MVLYCIRNLTSGREYIGVTRRTLKARWSDHLSGAFGKKLNSPLYGDMRAFGRSAFECVVIAETDDHDTLMAMEQNAIREYDSIYPKGYNRATGGHVNHGWRHSEESKRHFSRIRTGLKASPETRARMSAAHRGRVFSDETKKRMSAWQVGRVMSADSRAKMRASKLGTTWTEQQRQLMAARPKRSPESLKKTSEKSLAYWASLTPEDRKHRSQKHAEKDSN